MNGETVTRLAQTLMLVSMVMLCNPVAGSRPAWVWMLIGSILLYAGNLQSRGPLMVAALPFLNGGIWMMLFLSRDPAQKSMATMTDIDASSVEVYRVDHV